MTTPAEDFVKELADEFYSLIVKDVKKDFHHLKTHPLIATFDETTLVYFLAEKEHIAYRTPIYKKKWNTALGKATIAYYIPKVIEQLKDDGIISIAFVNETTDPATKYIFSRAAEYATKFVFILPNESFADFESRKKAIIINHKKLDKDIDYVQECMAESLIFSTIKNRGIDNEPGLSFRGALTRRVLQQVGFFDEHWMTQSQYIREQMERNGYLVDSGYTDYGNEAFLILPRIRDFKEGSLKPLPAQIRKIKKDYQSLINKETAAEMVREEIDKLYPSYSDYQAAKLEVASARAVKAKLDKKINDEIEKKAKSIQKKYVSEQKVATAELRKRTREFNQVKRKIKQTLEAQTFEVLENEDVLEL